MAKKTTVSEVELETPAEVQTSIILMSVADFLRVVIVGACAGILLWVLGIVLDHYVVTPLLCRDGVDAALCVSAPDYAWYGAAIIAAAAALLALVRLFVFRPLLVVLGAVVATWRLWALVAPLPSLAQVAVLALLFALIYGLFSWIARVRLFWLSLVLVIVAVLLIRIAFIAG